MEFLVMSEREIKTYDTDKIHIIISINSPSASKAEIPFNKKCLGRLYLSFHDLDNTHTPSPAINVILFTNEYAKDILNFVGCYDVELIICQCEAGISRSAGVAAALSKIINKDDTKIFKNYLPNMLVYRTILNEARKT